MSTRVVEVGRLRHTVAMEDPVPFGRSFWAVVRGRAIDELTGAAPRVPVRITTRAPGLTPRSAEGGLVGLLGYPAEVFPALAAQGYTVEFTLHADGYLALSGAAALPQDPQFPARFTPADLGDLPLHREPVILAGRVLRRVAGARTPVAGATVEVTAIWPVLPPADGSVAPLSPNLVSLRPPLHFARAAGAGPTAGRLRRREMTPVAGEDKELLDEAAAGATRLRVSDRVGLAAGSILLLDTDPSIEELVVIDTLDTRAAAALPTEVRLTHPLAYRHRRGARVRRVTPQAPSTFRQFARDAIAGDRCVFLDSLAALTAAQVVEVAGGAEPAEFHWMGRFVATSDAEGRFRFPPLCRVAQLTLQARAGADTTDPIEFAPDYTRRENRLDIEF
jgi:hypothetical protein